MAEKLTAKQEKYAQGLFAGLTQREAYRKAYGCENMTNKTIDEKACRLAGNDKIQARLQELTDKFANRNFVTVEKVLAELAKVAFAISAGKESIEIKMNDKIKALELMGKHLGMFTDKVEIGNKDGRPFRTEEVGKLTDEELDKRIQALMEVR